MKLGLWAFACCLFPLAVHLAGQLKPPPPESGWKPTHAPVGSEYVGSDVCASCHNDIFESHISSPMRHALVRLDDKEGLAFPEGKLKFKEGDFAHVLSREEDEVTYSVRTEDERIRILNPWVFGSGIAGQTFVFKRGDRFYEGRVSYFEAIEGLDLTIGHRREVPVSIDDAIGRKLSMEEVLGCFGCHSTASVSRGRLQLEENESGITCEGCHGAGAEHIRALTEGASPEATLLNPGLWTTDEVLDFCGTCHGTWRDVAGSGLQGVTTVRFQPYRLFLSDCYDPIDSRISCLSCHDPHSERETDPRAYDSACLACHADAFHREISDSERDESMQGACVTCHMPKHTIPGSHFEFSDHLIRVPGDGGEFPVR